MAIIQMTREEYKKKFGVEPNVPPHPSSTTTQTTPTTQEPKRHIGQKIAGFFGMEKFGQGLGQTIYNATHKKQNTELEKAVAEGRLSQKEYENVTTGNLTDKEVVGSALSTAAMFAPGAGAKAGLAAKVGAGAATGYAMDVGSKLQDTTKTTEESLQLGVGTIVGGTLPILGNIFGKGISPKKLEQINLRLTPVEKQNLAKQGKDVADWLSKKKLTGTPEVRYEKINSIYDNLENKVSSVVEKSGFKITKGELMNAVSQIPEQFGDDIAGFDEASNATQKVLKFLQEKAPEEIDGKLLNKYKRTLFKRAYAKNNTDVLNESLHATASKFKEILDNNIPELEAINQEYGNVITAKKLLFKAMSRPQTGAMGKLFGMGAGGAIGASLGGGWGAAAGMYAGEKIAEKTLGTGFRSQLGAGVQTILEKIPEDKMGNLQISKKALISLLQGMGY